MSSSLGIVPNNPQTREILRQIALAADDEIPIVAMNDVTARDMSVIQSSLEAVTKRWRGEQNSRIPGHPMDRKEFWGAYAGNHPGTPLPLANDFIDRSNGFEKVAIDLGCGNSPVIRPLLDKGWRIIAVDYSKPTLNILANLYEKEIASEQLTIIEDYVTEFTPDKPVDLVIAADIFPYINPTNFQNTLKKIHDTFLKENGFLIGNIFRTTSDTPQVNITKEMGAWLLPDRRMVRPLLTAAGYEIQTCTFRIDDPGKEPVCIQFVAKKTVLI